MPLGWQLPRRLCGATVLHLCMAPSLLSLSLAESLTGQWLSSAAWMWMQDFCGGAALSALETVYPFERPSIFHNIRTKSFVFFYSSHIIKTIPMTELHWCALQPEITWRWCVTLLKNGTQNCTQQVEAHALLKRCFPLSYEKRAMGFKLMETLAVALRVRDSRMSTKSMISLEQRPTSCS